MSILAEVKLKLNQYANAEKIPGVKRFFKATPGGYAEGDQFIGITVPDQRKVAKKYFQQISLGELEQLLQDPIHEYRLTALFTLVYKYQKAVTADARQQLVDLYLNNLAHVNNWDLVDSSADKLLGAYLFDKNKDLLYQLANSGHLWKQRISIIATYHFIKQGQYEDTLKIAEILLTHKHDLIHKAVGWMLREVGNRDLDAELSFLHQHHTHMPRTMLRYAVEKFPSGLRAFFMKKQ